MRPTIVLAGVFAALLALPLAAQESVTISHGVSPFGELKYPEGFAHFDYVNPDAPKGGTMSFRGTGASGTFDSLNPFILAGEPAQGLERIYDTLMTASDDEPGALYGLIAETVEYPADRAWAIFDLRPEARFADGHPLTAEDVVWTLETLQTDGEPWYQIQLDGVAKVEALDPHRVRVTFAEDVPTRDLPATVAGIEILPKHYYADRDFTRSTLDPPLGSGPYVVDQVQPGRRIRYCRNPDYWAADLNVNVGRNNFDCYVYEYFADTTAAFEALKVGNYLFHEEFSSAIWGSGYDFPALEKGWVRREEIADRRPSGTQGFWLNLRREKLRDIRVRQAVAMLFNFEWSNESLFHGLYKRTDSFWENSDLQAEGLPEGEELAVLEPFRDRLPPGIFTEPAVVPPVHGAQQIDRATIRAASRLLEDAGWSVGADGLRRNAAGQALTLTVLDDNPAFERIVVPFVQNLRQAGIDARYDLIDPAQMQERQQAFDYDIIPGRLVMSLSPSTDLRSLFGSKGATGQGTLNFSGVADPVVDGLIEAVVGATSRDQMRARVRALDRVLRAMHIWVPNWYRDAWWIAYWDVFGRPEVQPPYARGDDYWWFDRAKYDALVAAGALR